MGRELGYRHCVRFSGAVVFFFFISVWGIPHTGDCSPDVPGETEQAHAPTSGQASADAAIRQGRELSARGDFKAALAALAPFIHAPETYPTIYSDYLVTLIWANRAEEAIRLFEQLPEAVPRRPYLLMHMAGANRRAGNLSRAGALYHELLQAEPDNIDALEGLVMVLVESGDPDGAIQALVTAGERGGNPFAVHLLKAQVLMRKADYIKSLILYDTIMDTWPEQRIAIARTRDDLIAGLPPEDQEKLMATLKSRVQPENRLSKANYALALSLCRRYETAVAFMDSAALNPDELPVDRLYRMAWAYLRAGRPQDAKRHFDAILTRQGDHLPARIGLIYCLAGLGHTDQARSTLNTLLPAHPDDLELNFAQAHVQEKQGHFWEAVQVYDHILVLSPGNAPAQRLRLRALSDLGATSVAQQTAARLFPDDTALHATLSRDQGVTYIHWQEPHQAVSRLAALTDADAQPQNIFNYINALVQAGQYQEAIQAYQAAATGDKPVPCWVKQTVADAYMARRQPEQALPLYDELLTAAPDDNTYLLGKFYALQNLRRWQAADDLLAAIQAGPPQTIVRNGKPQPNPAVYELALVEAWYLADQGRLDEAQACFSELHRQAPANLEARNGLAHVYLWRGWPRRALAEFDNLHGLDARYAGAWPAYIATLNQLNQKARARELADTVTVSPPADRYIREARRAMDVEQMKLWRTDASIQREEDDTRDMRIRTELSAPFNLQTRWFSYLLWQHTEYGDEAHRTDDPEDLRRFGIGLHYAPNDLWQFRPSLSANLDDGQDLGATLRIECTPSDLWTFGLSGDTFSTDLAGRARAADIDAATIGIDARWRQSDQRQASAGLVHTFFSDDNVRQELLLDYQQHLWRHHDWRLRGYADFYWVGNTQGDETIYYNPKQAWELSVTTMIEQTLQRFYQRSFVHRLYVTLGDYHQTGYGGDWVGSLRYEQAHDFSDRHALQVGISIGRRVYDGDAVSDFQMDAVYQYRF